MDNASTHLNEELVAVCDAANVLLVYLPPYSPDLNPIENSFAPLKAWIKDHSHLIPSYTEEAGGLQKFLEDALEAVTFDISHDAEALFREARIECSLTFNLSLGGATEIKSFDDARF